MRSYAEGFSGRREGRPRASSSAGRRVPPTVVRPASHGGPHSPRDEGRLVALGAFGVTRRRGNGKPLPEIPGEATPSTGQRKIRLTYIINSCKLVADDYRLSRQKTEAFAAGEFVKAFQGFEQGNRVNAIALDCSCSLRRRARPIGRSGAARMGSRGLNGPFAAVDAVSRPCPSLHAIALGIRTAGRKKAGRIGRGGPFEGCAATFEASARPFEGCAATALRPLGGEHKGGSVNRNIPLNIDECRIIHK